jgi:phenylacetate-CoA ligase
METMPQDERDKIILEKLQKQISYVYASSSFYQDFYRGAEVDPKNITTFEEFRRLPLLTKEHIRREQEAHPPFGRFLCIPQDQIFHVHGTSGTTGRPTVFAIGADDWIRIREAHARILWSAGLRPTDCVMIAAVFGMYVGSWGALLGAERLGAKCFPFGAGTPGQTERAVDWITLVKPTVLYGTPSYVLHLAETARRMGYDPRRDFNFRFMFFSGEPGASIPSTRREIEETYGCYVVDQGSMAEMTPWMSNSGCRYLGRGMHMWTDIVYTEILDPGTKEPVPPGHEGVLVYSHLERTSQPMIRYWSGDLARWNSVDCKCGRTYPTLTEGIYGRVDDMVTVRGQNVFPSKVEDILRGMEEFGGEFRLIIDRAQSRLDRLTVQVELKSSAYQVASERPEKLAAHQQRISHQLLRGLGVSVSVELKPEGSFERTQFKARRVIDNRGIWKVTG